MTAFIWFIWNAIVCIPSKQERKGNSGASQVGFQLISQPTVTSYGTLIR